MSLLNRIRSAVNSKKTKAPTSGLGPNQKLLDNMDLGGPVVLQKQKPRTLLNPPPVPQITPPTTPGTRPGAVPAQPKQVKTTATVNPASKKKPRR